MPENYQVKCNNTPLLPGIGGTLCFMMYPERMTAWAFIRFFRLAVYYLTAYSPDLNLDEHLNCDLKNSVSSQPLVREQAIFEHAI